MSLLAFAAAALLTVLTAPPPEAAALRRFIVGTPDRLALAGDRQHPRRHECVASAIAAYADIDEVVDPTWLPHEVEGYARRAAACAPPAAVPCRRAPRRLGTAWGIHLVTGSRAEIVWTSGRRAVRLGWRRVVNTPTGSMTLDDPPAEFAAALLAELPSDLHRVARAGEAWADAELDRRLYYVGRALDAVAAEPAAPSAASLRFVRAGLLAVEAADGMGGDVARQAAEAEGVAALIAVRARWAAALARRAAARQPPFLPADPCCPAPILADAPPLARLP
jgi:hypothetical protein